MARRSFGNTDSRTLTSTYSLATVLEAQGKSADAEPLLRTVLAGAREALGPKHPTTKASADELAMMLWQQGKRQEADRLRQEGSAQQ